MENRLRYMMTPRNSMSITYTKGLLNMPGQNNCFLNSAVQVLWHLDIFRRSFREIKGHACMGESCIFCALKELFAQFQYSQESALPPDALRRALAETFFDQRRFQLGFMDDAAECFENILMRIHYHIANQEPEDMCTLTHCIAHQKFAMTLVEQNVCHVCGATSEPLSFTQMVHYVSSSALCSQASLMISQKIDPTQAFGQLLRQAGSMGEVRNCPSACGAKIQICRALMNHPEIVSIGVVWDSENPTLDHIMDVIKAIGLKINLQDTFHSVVDGSWVRGTTHQLVGIVTYYGKHYSTFFFHTKLRIWIYFDDAAVCEIGPKWDQVVDKCYRGHFQPLLLLYVDPQGSPVSSETAPKSVTVVAGHSKPQKDIFSKEDAYSSSGNHRRAFTPNPETSQENITSVQPRRAITPSGELSCRSVKNHFHSQFRQSSLANVVSNKNGRHLSFKQSHPLQPNSSCEWQPHYLQNYLKHSSASVLSEQQDEHSGGGMMYSGNLSVETSRCKSSVSACQNKSNSEEISRNTQGMKKIEGTSHGSPLKPSCGEDVLQQRKPVSVGQFGSRIVMGTNSENGNTYISRQAVESILKAQKLQWQKTLIGGVGLSTAVGTRNFNNAAVEKNKKSQDKSVTGDLTLKIDIPDFPNTFGRRDSGNWSGDCNSASSMSSSSVDNIFSGVVAGSRQNINLHQFGNLTRTHFDSNTQGTTGDLGYDSFSLSSTESYQSARTNSPSKTDHCLIQITEGMQTVFQKSNKVEMLQKESHAKGARDDCDKLCVQADALLIKSQEKEKEGQLKVATLLSDVAAAKAREAMDAPYSNPKSLTTAKMKHRRCIMRSSALHSRLKEIENEELKSRNEANSCNLNKCLNPDVIVSTDDSSVLPDQPINTSTLVTECSSSGNINERDEKVLQIYATLPKKGRKYKNNQEGLEDAIKVNGEQPNKNTPEEKEKFFHQQSSKSRRDFATRTKSFSEKINLDDKERLSLRKTDGPNISDVTSLFKDKNVAEVAGNDNPRSNLHRTYSVPSASLNKDQEKSTDMLNQTFSGQPSKKQHRVRRRLLGGFMRRKNRSLPDLREDKDQDEVISNSYDDSTIFGMLRFTKLHQVKPSTYDEFCTGMQGQKNKKTNLQDSQMNKRPMKNYTLLRKESHVTEPGPSDSNFKKESTVRSHMVPPALLSQNFNNKSNVKLSPWKVSNRSNKPNIQSSEHLPKAFIDQENIRQEPVSSEHNPKRKILEKNEDKKHEYTTSVNSGIKEFLNKTQEVETSDQHDLPKNLHTKEVQWMQELQQKQFNILQKKKFQESCSSNPGELQNTRNKSPHTVLSETPKSIKCVHQNPEWSTNVHPPLQRPRTGFTTATERVKERESHLNNPQSVKVLASRIESFLKPASEHPSKDDNKSSYSQSSGNYKQALSHKSSLQISKQKELQSWEACSAITDPKLVDQPPDYETTLQRLGLLRNKWQSSDEMLSPTCASYEMESGSKIPEMKKISSSHVSDFIPGYHKQNSSLLGHTRQEAGTQPISSVGTSQARQNVKCKHSCNYTAEGVPNSYSVPSLVDISKKKPNAKKCVTFSDCVVLVECDEDRGKGISSNTQFQEMAEKSSMQRQVSGIGSGDKATLRMTTQPPKLSSSNQSSETFCNLCHKAVVVPPTVYCANCACYLARFK